jgi:hypothetical protein
MRVVSERVEEVGIIQVSKATEMFYVGEGQCLGTGLSHVTFNRRVPNITDPDTTDVR